MYIYIYTRQVSFPDRSASQTGQPPRQVTAHLNLMLFCSPSAHIGLQGSKPENLACNRALLQSAMNYLCELHAKSKKTKKTKNDRLIKKSLLHKKNNSRRIICTCCLFVATLSCHKGPKHTKIQERALHSRQLPRVW